MALGDSYATLAELKTRLGIGDSADDTRLTEALATASRGIDKVCQRQFNKATGATARVYYPDDRCLARIDDFWTTSGLVVATDEDADGTYETTWTVTTDYQLEPLNGVVAGELGWPFWRIRAVGTRYFPQPFRSRANVQVTAQWGWAAVPAPVKEATLATAEETFKLRDAPFGVAGYGDYGVVRVRTNPIVMAMIGPYRLDPILGA